MPELSNEQIGQLALEIAEAVMGNEIVEVTFAPGDEQDRFRSDIQIETTRVLRMALQQRRASAVTPDWSSSKEREAAKAGEGAAFAYSKTGGGPIGVFLEGLRAYRAALSVVSHETGDGETTLSRDTLAEIISKAGAPPGPPDGPVGSLPDGHYLKVQAYKQADAVLAAVAASSLPAPTDETQGVKRLAVALDMLRHLDDEIGLVPAKPDAVTLNNLRYWAHKLRTVLSAGENDGADHHDYDDPDCRYYRDGSGRPAPYPNGMTKAQWDAGPTASSAERAKDLPED